MIEIEFMIETWLFTKWFKFDIISIFQDRISNPQKGDKIDECVQIIMKTGCFSIANGAFTFDLCLLDKKTVKKMVDILKIDYEKYEK